MKRFFAFFVIFFIVFSIFAAENANPSDDSAEEVFRQYQTFSWEPVPKARKYEVVVEAYKDKKWVHETSVQTKKTRTEVLLTPGQKRVSIVSYNLLGKKASVSDWVSFIVLSEMQPYLYDDYLRKSTVWNSPILRATHGTGEETGDDLESEAGDPKNSFFVKGKNIFFEGTKFYLVPSDSSSSGGKKYDAFITNRKRSPLKVVRRDYDRSGVVVSYNADDLFSGYYKIVAENPGGMNTSLDILVFADRAPVFDMSNFEFDEDFNVPKISKSDIEGNGDVINVRGSGFSFDTSFSLAPSESGIPYPFASAISRDKLDLKIYSSKSLSGSGNLEVSTLVDSSSLRSGYYKLVAESSSGRAEQLILVTDDEDTEDLPIIKSIKGLTDKKSDQVTFEINGKGLSRWQTMTLISTVNEISGVNNRISLAVVDYKKSGTKMYVQANKDELASGVYALIIESDDLYKKYYLEIDKKYDVSIKKESEINIAETFYPSPDFVPPTLALLESAYEDIPASPDDLYYSALDYTVQKKYTKHFPTINGAMVMGNRFFTRTNFDLIGFNFSVDLVRLDWFMWDIGAGGVSGAGNGFAPEVSTTFYLTTPFKMFNPFLALEIGGYYGRTKDFADFVPDYEYKPFGMELGFFGGIIILDYFQLSYSLRLLGADEYAKAAMEGKKPDGYRSFFYDNVYFGVRFPIRPYNYTRVATSSTLTVTKAGIVSGLDYTLDDGIKRIVFAAGAKVIEHFTDMSTLEEVSLPEGLEKIGKHAFYGCYNLYDIVIPDGVVEIGDHAFDGCDSIRRIYLPSSIRKISPTAFASWKDREYSQYIYADWDSDDDTVRDLGGLDKYRNFVLNN